MRELRMQETNTTDVRVPAIMKELQEQRAFLGDRAANLAADLAEKENALEMAMARIRSLEKELEEWKKQSEPELPLET